MVQHTKGSHCKQEWAITAGSWWTEPCFCDRVQPLNQNAIGAGGQAQQWFGTVTINPNAATTATTVPTFTYTWPDPNTIYVPIPQVHYHYCQHEEVSKNLLALIEKLVDRIVELEKK